MYKRLFVVILLIMFLVSGMFGASKKDFYRRNYPDKALYQTISVEWQDPAAASATAVVNNQHISTATLLAMTTGLGLTIGAQTDHPRNFQVIVASIADVGCTFAGTLAITGTDSTGIVRTESIAVSTIAATGLYGFAYVTRLQLIMTSGSGWAGANEATDLAIRVGYSYKMGLPVDINATTDVYMVGEDGAVTDPSSKANATYNTIDFAADPDGSKDYEVSIRAPLRKKAISEE